MTVRKWLASTSLRDWEAPVEEDNVVRFAHIGVGWWTTEEVIPALANSDYCETTVLVTGSLEKARSLCNEHESITQAITYEEFSQGVASDNYDAVYIVTPNGTHLEYARAAARMGKPVLCEKPMERDIERAAELCRVCETKDVPLMIAYRMQTEPAVRRVRELLESGLIGEPVQIHSGISADLLAINDDPDQWRLDTDLSGGCAVMDLGIYPINTIRFLLDADPLRVRGETYSEHEAFGDVDEHATFEMVFPDHVTASCTASHNACLNSHLDILGTDGRIRIDPVYHPWSSPSVVIDIGDTQTQVSFEQIDQMEEEFDYFANSLLTDRDVFPDGKHGLIDMEIIDAIYTSARDSETDHIKL